MTVRPGRSARGAPCQPAMRESFSAVREDVVRRDPADDGRRRRGVAGYLHRQDGRLLRALGWEDEDHAWYTVRHPRLTTSTTRAELFREELDVDWYDEWDEDDWDEGHSGFWDEHASHM